MFKSQFKESTTNEIPLPEKNARGVVKQDKIPRIKACDNGETKKCRGNPPKRWQPQSR